MLFDTKFLGTPGKPYFQDPREIQNYQQLASLGMSVGDVAGNFGDMDPLQWNHYQRLMDQQKMYEPQRILDPSLIDHSGGMSRYRGSPSGMQQAPMGMGFLNPVGNPIEYDPLGGMSSGAGQSPSYLRGDGSTPMWQLRQTDMGMRQQRGRQQAMSSAMGRSHIPEFNGGSFGGRGGAFNQSFSRRSY